MTSCFSNRAFGILFFYLVLFLAYNIAAGLRHSRHGDFKENHSSRDSDSKERYSSDNELIRGTDVLKGSKDALERLVDRGKLHARNKASRHTHHSSTHSQGRQTREGDEATDSRKDNDIENSLSKLKIIKVHRRHHNDVRRDRLESRLTNHRGKHMIGDKRREVSHIHHSNASTASVGKNTKTSGTTGDQKASSLLSTVPTKTTTPLTPSTSLGGSTLSTTVTGLTPKNTQNSASTNKDGKSTSLPTATTSKATHGNDRGKKEVDEDKDIAESKGKRRTKQTIPRHHYRSGEDMTERQIKRILIKVLSNLVKQTDEQRKSSSRQSSRKQRYYRRESSDRTGGASTNRHAVPTNQHHKLQLKLFFDGKPMGITDEVDVPDLDQKSHTKCKHPGLIRSTPRVFYTFVGQHLDGLGTRGLMGHHGYRMKHMLAKMRGNNSNRALEIQFSQQTLVYGIIQQPSHEDDDELMVTEFAITLPSTEDKDKWFPMEKDGQTKIYTFKRTWKRGILFARFSPPVQTSVLRIYPQQWQGLPYFRLAFLGCTLL